MITNPIIQRLRSEGVDEALFSNAQILLLPENILQVGEGEELLETTDMNAFSKALRGAGARTFTFMDAGIDLAAIDRRAGDKWLGTVWVRDVAAIPFLTSVVSGMIVLGVERATDSKNSPPAPISNIHIELVVEGKNGGQKSVKYKGDGKTLIEIIKLLKDE